MPSLRTRELTESNFWRGRHDLASDAPYGEMNLDIMGPFVTSERGNRYVFVLIDDFFKFRWTSAARIQKSRRLISFLEDVWATVGLPQVLRTDNGRNLTSTIFESYRADRRIQHVLSTPYHPESNGNGQTEPLAASFER